MVSIQVSRITVHENDGVSIYVWALYSKFILVLVSTLRSRGRLIEMRYWYSLELPNPSTHPAIKGNSVAPQTCL